MSEKTNSNATMTAEKENAVKSMKELFRWTTVVDSYAMIYDMQVQYQDGKLESASFTDRNGQTLSLNEMVQEGSLPVFAAKPPHQSVSQDVLSVQETAPIAQATYKETLDEMNEQRNALERSTYLLEIGNAASPYQRIERNKETGAFDVIETDGFKRTIPEAITMELVPPEMAELPDLTAHLPVKNEDKLLAPNEEEIIKSVAIENAMGDLTYARDYVRAKAYCGKVIEGVTGTSLEREENGTYIVNSDVINAQTGISNDLKKELMTHLNASLGDGSELTGDNYAEPNVTLSWLEVDKINDSVSTLAALRAAKEDVKESINKDKTKGDMAEEPPLNMAQYEVHEYGANDYVHASKRLKEYIRRGKVKQEEVDNMLNNFTQMEEAGKLPVGIDADGNKRSNSEIYAYKMLQARELYHPQEWVYKTEGKNLTRQKDGHVQDKLGGNHRKALNSLSKGAVAQEEVDNLAAVVLNVENAITAKGQATAAVKVSRRMSYNRMGVPGYTAHLKSFPTNVVQNAETVQTEPETLSVKEPDSFETELAVNVPTDAQKQDTPAETVDESRIDKKTDGASPIQPHKGQGVDEAPDIPNPPEMTDWDEYVESLEPQTPQKVEKNNAGDSLPPIPDPVVAEEDIFDETQKSEIQNNAQRGALAALRNAEQSADAAQQDKPKELADNEKSATGEQVNLSEEADNSESKNHYGWSKYR